MKKRILILSVLTLILHATSWAYDFSAVNDDGKTIYYGISSSSDKTCYVTYRFKDSSNRNYYTGSIVIPETVTYNGDVYTVVSIGANAFYDCMDITDITISNTVTRILDYAFHQCKFTEIIIPNSVTEIGSAFCKCSNLTDVTIGNSVSTIGSQAFYECTGLKEVTIPNSVTEIGSGAFESCSGLTEVTLPESVTSIGSDAFGYCTELTQVNFNATACTSAGDDTYNYSVFEGCSKLTDIIIGDNVTIIPNNLFMDCTAVTEITISEGITSIGAHSFANCTKLAQVNFNATACTTANSTKPSFYGCTNLSKAIIGDNVTIIPDYLFYHCTELAEVAIGNSVTEIGFCAFNGCSSLTELTIPESVTKIGGSAFRGCSILKELNIGNNVVTIGTHSFQYCYELPELSIPSSVMKIGEFAFESCTKLPEVTIPNSVTELGDGVFQNCTKLTTVTIEDGADSSTLTTPNSTMYALFKDCPIETLYLGRNLSHDSAYSPFKDNKNLTRLTIGNTVTIILSSEFSGCSSLKELTLKDGEETLTMTTSSSNTPFTNCPIEILYLGRNLIFSDSVYSPFKNNMSLKSLTIGCEVNEIVSYTFYGCTGLTEVDIVNGVTLIGDAAFEECTGLTGTLTIPGSVSGIGNSAFRNCVGLTQVEIANGVTSIGDAAFEECAGLTGTLTIPGSVSSIGNSAFRNCAGLTEVDIVNGVTSIGDAAFAGCLGLTGTLTIPNSVSELGEGAFEDCSGLTGILTIPGSVSSIGNSAFRNCAGLTEVDIVNGVTSIGSYAFQGCSGLAETLIIPESVTEIGDGAFEDCSGLIEAVIGNGVISVGTEAFAFCTSLVTLILEDGVDVLAMETSSSSTPFDDCPIESLYWGRDIAYSDSFSPFKNKTSLTSLTISKSVTDIPSYSFYGCSGMVGTLAIPESVTTIGAYAFYNCSGLTGTLTIPNSVTEIGDHVFFGCSGLSDVIIHNDVTSIGQYTFGECSGLTTLTIPWSVTSIGTLAFCNCTSLITLILEDGEEVLAMETSSSSTPFDDCPIEKLYLGRNVIFSSTSNTPFKNNTTLTSLIIGEKVEDISYQSFYSCTSLIDVTIGNGVTSIDNQAFMGCTSLVTLILEDGEETLTMTTSSSYTPFSSCPIESLYLGRDISYSDSYSPFKNKTSLTSLTISESVTDVPSYSFYGCSGLSGELTIPNSVVQIGEYAFYNCSSLTGTLTIPSSMGKIENYTFYGCSGLTGLSIPSSVTSIGTQAFYNCKSLDSLTLEDGEETLTMTTNSSSTPFSSCPIESLYLGRNISFSDSYSPFKNKTSLTSLTISGSVTYIPSYSFYGCSGLSGELIIPNSVVQIGEYAFYNCSSLTGTLNIPSSVDKIENYTFYGCSGLTKLVIPNNVTSIGAQAFYNCSSLTGTLNIPSSVDKIENYTFYGCSGLTKLVIPNNVTSIGSQAFYNCTGIRTLNLEDGEETLTMTTGSSTTPFSGCPIETLYLGRNLSYSNGSYSPFMDKTSLTSLTISESVTDIPSYSFYGCSGLTGITIPESVTGIGEHAFSGCTGLTGELVIPNSVTSIGREAFAYCTNLKTLTFEDGEELLTMDTSWVSSSSSSSEATTFTNCPITSLYLGRNVSYNSYSPFMEIKSLTELTISESVTTIGTDAFWCCTGLTEVFIPNSVTTIGMDAFYGCTSLKTLTFEDGEETLTITTEASHITFNKSPIETLYLGRNMSFSSSSYSPFKNNTSLTSLTISGSVTDIPSYAFYDCSNLTGITSLNTMPPTIYSSTFSGVVNVEVPKEALLTYAVADIWEEFRRIYAIENGNTYYPIAIIHEGSSIVSADGSTDGAVAKKGETVMITPLSGNSQVNGIVVYRAEDIVEEINGSGHYPVEVAEYHLNNRVYTYGIDTQHYFDITVPSAGQVLEELTVYNISSVYGLKVTGDVNGTDIMTIRKMPYIELLDLSDANIVSGGDPYYDYYETEDSTIGNYFFVDMPNLKYIRIPNNTTSIGNYAFKDLTGLKGIVIPGTVTSISSNAFQGCTSLTSISFEDGEEILKMTTSSSSTPFTDCPITSLYLGRDLSYNNSPFKNKQMLTSLVISNSVTAIGNSEFSGCTGLIGELVIHSSVTRIGSEAFAGCTGLTALTLEDGVETLTMTTSSSSTPFTNCPIETLYLGRNVTYSSSSYTVCKNNAKLASLTIGNNVTDIASYSFYGCTGLTEVIFPESLDTINSYAFSGCTRLTKVLFPDNVTSIGNSAFENCTRLTAITIGSNVESIGALAFGGCSQLSLIDSRAVMPPDITSDTFDEVDKRTCLLNVPTGSINAYWLHLYWGLFFYINEKDAGLMTPVDGVTANGETEILGYYTTDGKKVSQPQRGINIILYSNGTVKKVLVK